MALNFFYFWMVKFSLNGLQTHMDTMYSLHSLFNKIKIIPNQEPQQSVIKYKVNKVLLFLSNDTILKKTTKQYKHHMSNIVQLQKPSTTSFSYLIVVIFHSFPFLSNTSK